MADPRRLLLWCTLTAGAFGVVEGAVVVYLRELLYPEGFAFPLKEIPRRLLVTEVVREAATIVLLAGVAWLAERSALRRFAVFAFCFGVWDIVYYGTLKAALGWPPSLLAWDVLFLIPLPWTGPVLAPVLVSVALVAAGTMILRAPDGGFAFLRPADWALEILAGAMIVASFLWSVPAVADGTMPSSFPWWLFLPGYAVGIGWFAWRARRGARRSLS